MAQKRRPLIVRETTINAINQMRGQYRSPKKALFMSLMVPGLGQAYVGQNKFNYIRAAGYFAIDVLLGAFWYDYVVVKHDLEVRRYEHYADSNWSQTKYEDSIAAYYGNNANVQPQFDQVNPSRAAYCGAVTQAGNSDNQGCLSPYATDQTTQSDYQSFLANIQLNESSGNPAIIHTFRAGFPDPAEFYNLIGQEQEFITGWKDAQGTGGYLPVSADSGSISGTSAERTQYLAMQALANRYSRMQAYFIGGIILNHIASALDAALTATANNRQLYQTNAMWYDHLHFDGGFAFDAGWPRTSLTASIYF